jgi:hypothetical protein
MSLAGQPSRSHPYSLITTLGASFNSEFLDLATSVMPM